MAEEEVAQNKPRGTWRYIAGLLALTGIWCYTAYLIWAGSKFESLCATTFSCLRPNEWGDFFAGMFAPIAFLWVAAAVIIQSHELYEQRKEFIQTREVLGEQAAQARQQAEYIAEQTNLLRSDERRRELADNDRLFSALIKEIALFATRRSTSVMFSEKNGENPIHLTVKDTGDAKLTTLDFFASLEKTWIGLPAHLYQYPGILFSQNPGEAEVLLSILIRAENAPDLSAEGRVYADSFRLPRMRWIFEEILRRCENRNIAPNENIPPAN